MWTTGRASGPGASETRTKPISFSPGPKATQWLVLSQVAVQSRNSRVTLGGLAAAV